MPDHIRKDCALLKVCGAVGPDFKDSVGRWPSSAMAPTPQLAIAPNPEWD
jgi:hypothetical protein